MFEMSGRILAIISLFVVFAVTSTQGAPGNRNVPRACYCHLIWSKRNNPKVTFQIPQVVVEGSEIKEVFRDRDEEFSVCRNKCEESLTRGHGAKNLRFDWKGQLGRELCEAENVVISHLAPRTISMVVRANGRDGDNVVETVVEIGELCCFQCPGDRRTYYNRGCSSDPSRFMPMVAGVACEV